MTPYRPPGCASDAPMSRADSDGPYWQGRYRAEEIASGRSNDSDPPAHYTDSEILEWNHGLWIGLDRCT